MKESKAVYSETFFSLQRTKNTWKGMIWLKWGWVKGVKGIYFGSFYLELKRTFNENSVVHKTNIWFAHIASTVCLSTMLYLGKNINHLFLFLFCYVWRMYEFFIPELSELSTNFKYFSSDNRKILKHGLLYYVSFL